MLYRSQLVTLACILVLLRFVGYQSMLPHDFIESCKE